MIKSLSETLTDPELNLREDLMQSGIEGLLSNSEIPGLMLKGYKAIHTIHDVHLRQKTKYFIIGFREGKLSDEEIDEYRNKMSDGKVANRELGYVLVLLDRQIDLEKSLILGRAYRAFYMGEIAWEEFTELADALDRAFISDLMFLSRYGYNPDVLTEARKEKPHIIQRLQGIGIVIEDTNLGNGYTYSQLEGDRKVLLTKLGKLLYEMMHRGLVIAFNEERLTIKSQVSERRKSEKTL